MGIMKKNKKEPEEKILDIDAGMKGTMTFHDPVNLRINGRFEGELRTKGSLTVGEKALVNADIHGESVTVAGKVTGDIIATREIKMLGSSRLVGDIHTPVLSIQPGAVLHGNCQMLTDSSKAGKLIAGETLTPDELAKYLEVDTSVIFDWAKKGRIPSVKDHGELRFDRDKVDEWIASEKIK